jgi:transposase-like protein
MRLRPSTLSSSVEYDKAVECLIRNRDALLAFYDFPAEHWKHLRTTDEMDKEAAKLRWPRSRRAGSINKLSSTVRGRRPKKNPAVRGGVK